NHRQAGRPCFACPAHCLRGFLPASGGMTLGGRGAEPMEGGLAERHEQEDRRDDDARELVRAALEAAGVAAVLCDKAREVVSMTQAAQALLSDAALARNEDDLLGRLAARATEPKSLVDLRDQAEAGG